MCDASIEDCVSEAPVYPSVPESHMFWMVGLSFFNVFVPQLYAALSTDYTDEYDDEEWYLDDGTQTRGGTGGKGKTSLYKNLNFQKGGKGNRGNKEQEYETEDDYTRNYTRGRGEFDDNAW